MDLVAWIREDFGIPLIGAHPTGLGADARAATFLAESADGARYAVKTSTAPQRGLVVADFLATQGVCGVPAPVRALDGGLTAGRGDQRVSVVPWVGARRALDGGMDHAHWHRLGRLLAQVHAATADDRVLADLPTERPGGADPSGLVDLARAMSDRLAHGNHEDSLVLELRVLWGAHQSRVHEVGVRAEALAASRAWAAAPYVVCHADPHQGNVVVGADGEVWLLDWDDAVRAPREADLVFALGGVLAFAPITAGEQQAFFTGYGTTDWDPELMGYFRCVRALDDVTSWAEDVLATTRHTDDGRREALDIVRGILSPTGLVAHALGEAPSWLTPRRGAR